MNANEELLSEYIRIANTGYEVIRELASTQRESIDYIEILYLSDALSRLPYRLKYHTDFQIEMTNATLDRLINKYPQYKYFQDEFLTATRKYLAKQKPRKSRASSSSSKGAV